MTNSTYDVLAWIGRIVLPSLSVFYATIGKIWNLPYTEQIPLTITAIDVLWNALLGITSTKYFEDKEIVTAINNRDSIESNG